MPSCLSGWPVTFNQNNGWKGFLYKLKNRLINNKKAMASGSMAFSDSYSGECLLIGYHCYRAIVKADVGRFSNSDPCLLDPILW